MPGRLKPRYQFGIGVGLKVLAGYFLSLGIFFRFPLVAPVVRVPGNVVKPTKILWPCVVYGRRRFGGVLTVFATLVVWLACFAHIHTP